MAKGFTFFFIRSLVQRVSFLGGKKRKSLVGLSLLTDSREQQMFHSVQIFFKKYKTWVVLEQHPKRKCRIND